ncbi:hypothetical protein [Nitrobacter winogradskyi]|uniref:Uncharacterized protein n=2 Tax=Nitrobacter winogradskyi TaxID=913 RepID=A0ACC6AG26_NITWI|nr:hypothetical protein [Nitrobacter winogradskyi]MCP1998812.1 hypothetical protein [Nitrobacter winogradskyi]GEC14266.1 hypothetical protein NWI01_01580 [Nitrobacter winogradskyi]
MSGQEKIESLLKQMSKLSWPARAALLAQLTEQHGEGFADVVRREFARRYPKEASR